MIGMDKVTGRRLSGIGHLGQSIGDILGTPRGTRVKRREYGSDLFDLIDAPGNPLNAQRIIAASATAIARWEPRIRVDRVQSSVSFDGKIQIQIDGETTDGIRFSDVFIPGGNA